MKSQLEEEKRENRERALLVGVDTGEEHDFNAFMEELKQLAEACFMETVGVVTQKMEYVHQSLYIGTGKVSEVKAAVEMLEADIIIFNDALTPSQIKNLQDEMKKPILDRTTLILNIFEMRARTREAKLQVETAKLQYLLPRLVGMHEALTRQGGTSGSMSSRGAGEKKLELDRRKIEHRISELRKELEQISRERETQRKRRENSRLPLVALVGYTNAGKSTIMNGMVDKFVKDEEKRVLEKDMLFATLDTTVRRINTGNNQDFLLTDTVGFIHKLPHMLVKAFQSTLEEVQGADLLIQVVDYSDPDYQEQMKTTWETLKELDACKIPMITVFNKVDLTENMTYPRVNGNGKIYLCARQKESLNLLVEEIVHRVYADYVETTFLIPYSEGRIASYLQENAQVLEQEYVESGIRMQVRCHQADCRKYEKYWMNEEKRNGSGTLE